MAYTKQQTMLTFSYMSYLGFTLHDTDKKNEEKILDAFNKALKSWKPIKNKWEVVWGPAVFALPGTQFDDCLMIVVRNIESPSQYVIAIRGTNPVSIPNWVVWDFQAKELKSWPYGNPESLNPKISESTNFGLIILQGLRPESGIPGAKKSILEFFNDELGSKGNADICVTGHSLGGALSSTMALWMKDIQGLQLSTNVNISTVAFAGPSAGNKDFAKYFDKRLGNQADRIANSLDIVPYAWNTETLKKISKLYCPLLPSLPIYLLFQKFILNSKGKQYTQIKANTPPLKGKYKWNKVPYIVQAIYQHVQGYPQLMDMKDDIPLKDLLPLPKMIRESLRSLMSAVAWCATK